MPPDQQPEKGPVSNPSPTPPPVTPRTESSLKQIRTFQGDIADALKRQDESLVSIQRAEHLKHGPPTPDEIEASKRRRQFVYLALGSLVLISAASLGAWFTYTEFVRKTVTPIPIALPNKFISTNLEVESRLESLTRDSIITAVSRNTENTPQGQLKHIVLKKASGEILSTQEFLSGLGSQAPLSLVRAFDPLFMVGSIGQNSPDTRTSTFIVIKLASFENAFAGMLAWEKSMARDIGPLFATALALRDIPIQSVFTDAIDRNKDMRVLALDAEPLLFYSFFDNNMLLITDNLSTMRTLIDRLTREKLSR